MEGLVGRGRRISIPVGDGEALLIDESYNANPASMAATLGVLGQQKAERRIAVLGDMRELGGQSPGFHAALAGPLEAANVEFALLVGPEMKALAFELEGKIDFEHVPDAAAALDRLHQLIAPGDAILIKGSNAIGLARVVDALASGKTICFT